VPSFRTLFHSTDDLFFLVQRLRTFYADWQKLSLALPQASPALDVVKYIIDSDDVQPCSPDSFFATSLVLENPGNKHDVKALIVRDALSVKTPAGKQEVRAGFASLYAGNSANMRESVRITSLPDILPTPSGLGRLTCKIPPGFGVFEGLTPDVPTMHNFKVGGSFITSANRTPFHYDYEGGSTMAMHIHGVKLWIFIPFDDKNEEVLTEFQIAGNLPKQDVVEVMRRCKNVRAAVIDTPVGFAISPFEHHAVFSLNNAVHIGGGVFFEGDTKDTFSKMNRYVDRILADPKWDQEGLKGQVKRFRDAVVTWSQAGGEYVEGEKLVDRLEAGLNKM
jgi:hypothetical protein